MSLGVLQGQPCRWMPRAQAAMSQQARAGGPYLSLVRTRSSQQLHLDTQHICQGLQYSTTPLNKNFEFLGFGPILNLWV